MDPKGRSEAKTRDRSTYGTRFLSLKEGSMKGEPQAPRVATTL